jgi:hypothetical protein
MTENCATPPFGLILRGGELVEGTHVAPPLGLILKRIPLLPSDHATYTFWPLLETVASFAIPVSLLKLKAGLNVGAVTAAATIEIGEEQLKRIRASAKPKIHATFFLRNKKTWHHSANYEPWPDLFIFRMSEIDMLDPW